jgi:protein-S-isoprenylcysteine O-methyltransferase Ste14
MPLQEDFEKQGLYLFRYRSVQPIALLAIGAAFYVWAQLYPENFLFNSPRREFYFEIGCLMVALLGLIIRIYTVGHTPKNTSGRNTTEQVADVVNTTGSYSLVRHPLYVGNFFMWLGPALLSANFWFALVFCLFYWIYYERIMYAEEQYLRKKFGKPYLDWAENVPAFFPNFRHFKKPSLPFSWKKVLKREKNGLAATFVIFSVFDVVGEYIKGTENHNMVLLIGSVVSLLLYVVVTILRKSSKILQEEGR